MKSWRELQPAHAWLFPVLAPLLLVQGLYVRRTIPRLPEPEGPRRGTTGRGDSLRLLILGDSAAAGVGVEHQTHALAGQLAQKLAQDFLLHWQLEAETGRTTQQTIEHLEGIAPQPFDVAVVSLGVNDLTAGIAAPRWIARKRQLLELLTARFQIRHVVLSRLPPMHLFPALPQPLRWYMGRRAAQFNQALERFARDSDRCELARPELDSLSTASDGFHPGAEVYAAWADALAALMRRRLRREVSAGRALAAGACTASE